MYPLGKQFEVDYTRSKSNRKNIIQGKFFRISVITERVVRLEYSPSGQFVDRPTQLVLRRDAGPTDFSVRQDTNIMEVVTRYFSLVCILPQIQHVRYLIGCRCLYAVFFAVIHDHIN